MIRTDVVVIGAGVIGASIAYQLARRGIGVAVVERSGLAAGSSAANGTSVLMQTKTPGPKLQFARDSLAMFRTLEEELDCNLEFVNDGGMLVAETADEAAFVASKVAQLRRCGLEIYYLDRREARARQPALAEHVYGSSYCPDDSTIDPFRLVMGWIAAAERMGSSIYTYTRVIGLEIRSHRVVHVKTTGGDLAAGAVVLACGLWTPELAQEVGVRIPIVPRRGQLSVTIPAPQFIEGKVLAAKYMASKKASTASAAETNGLNSGAVLHQTPRGNVLFGSTRESVGFDTRVTYEGQRELVSNVVRLVPRTRHLSIIRTFSGLRPGTPDGLPILDRAPEIQNLYVAAGHEGDGIALSPMTGLRLAQLIAGEISVDLLGPFRLSRFRSKATLPVHRHG